MKKLKLILVTTCISFTLVTLSNTFIGFTNNINSLSVRDIFQIAITCLMVSIGIYFSMYNSFLKEHFYIASYLIMMVVVFAMENFFRGYYFSWTSFFIEFTALTVIYIIVCFLTIYENEKDAAIINKKIKNMKKRNEK